MACLGKAVGGAPRWFDLVHQPRGAVRRRCRLGLELGPCAPGCPRELGVLDVLPLYASEPAWEETGGPIAESGAWASITVTSSHRSGLNRSPAWRGMLCGITAKIALGVGRSVLWAPLASHAARWAGGPFTFPLSRCVQPEGTAGHRLRFSGGGRGGAATALVLLGCCCARSPSHTHSAHTNIRYSRYHS